MPTIHHPPGKIRPNPGSPPVCAKPSSTLCFDTTVWDELCDPHVEDIDNLTGCITNYINFCVENTVSTKTVQYFSNNKPWINPDIKALLKEKKSVFRSGNKEELKAVQRGGETLLQEEDGG